MMAMMAWLFMIENNVLLLFCVGRILGMLMERLAWVPKMTNMA